ncbi:MAG: acyltransferase [Verrucomicrobiota bacterium JB022]|nr:acyltransferase [Verrucomicrobiota bacterium JB022]
MDASASTLSASRPADTSRPAPALARRYWDLDFLRIAGALGVILVHVCSRFQVDYTAANAEEFWLLNALNALVRTAPALFVMVSGALLLRPRKQELPDFYRRRLHRVGIPLAFWTVLYLGLRWVAGQVKESNPLVFALHEVGVGEPFWHLYFLYILAGLYLVTPFLQRFIAAAGQRWALYLGCLCLGLASLDIVLQWALGAEIQMTALNRFAPYLGFYVLGYVLYRHQDLKRHQGLAWALAAGGWALTAFGNGWMEAETGRESIFFNYLFPGMAMEAVGLFMLIRMQFGHKRYPSATTGRVLNFVASASLGIYLIHPIFLEGLARLGYNSAQLSTAVGVPALTLVTLLLSLVATAVMQRVPVLNHAVGN